MADIITGARVEVELTVPAAPAEFWRVVSDVTRIGEFSPECVGASWLGSGTPAPGARFTGRNDFGDGVGEAVCEVTESVPGEVFAWVVLDQHDDPRSPGSLWRYELAPAPGGGTRVRHTFEHGPGDSGVRHFLPEDPQEATEFVQGRWVQLREHMTQTIEAMARREPDGVS
ncbi:hypothetical protein JOF53_000236 [Crossiella equi]|uniref:Polyketide cyclase / dehydrase and lipid transport n=1 Tax=Crossiella equi TaxID=130796 RepID=A0ABS5A464_9PSEU|nr:SRPBCC family protein [Crossiella equi]MBP2471364.1 hypothetical protein [Crossiella equi]